MAAKRKQVLMRVWVSAPPEMTAAEVRREVRNLISEQCNWSADPGDIKVRSIKPVISWRA